MKTWLKAGLGLVLLFLCAAIPLQNSAVYVAGNAGLRATFPGAAYNGAVVKTTPGATDLSYTPDTGGVCQADDGLRCVAAALGSSPAYWLAQFPVTGIDPRWAGCKGDGATDDTACMQATWNDASALGAKVMLGPHLYAINSTGIACTTGLITVDGTQALNNNVNGKTVTSGFVALTANTTQLLSNACNGSTFKNFGILQGTQGQATTGISLFIHSATTVVDNVAIVFPCVGLDISGNSDVVNKLWVQTPEGSACGSMRVGSQTTHGGTVDLRFTNSWLVDSGVTIPTAAGFGLLVEDAGGMFMENDDILYSAEGTIFKPGLNQAVQWFTGTNTVLGDTTSDGAPLVFDTSDATGVINGWSCTNCWASNNASPGTFGYVAASNVLIQNTAGGTVQGIHFDGLRAYGAEGFGMLMNLGVSDVSVDNSQLCGSGAGASSSIFAAVAFGTSGSGTISGVRMRNNNFSASCDRVPASLRMEYAVIFANTTSTGVEMTGNKMYGGTSGEPVAGKPVWSGTAGTNPTNIFKDNPMIDDLQMAQTVTANAISPGVYDNLTIVGTNTVSTINDCWPGRKIAIRTAGTTTFATGGNIAGFNTAEPAANTITEFLCSSNGTWYGVN